MQSVSEQLSEARTQRERAREAFQSAKPGSKKWRLAEEELDFWQGRVAYLEAWR